MRPARAGARRARRSPASRASPPLDPGASRRPRPYRWCRHLRPRRPGVVHPGFSAGATAHAEASGEGTDRRETAQGGGRVGGAHRRTVQTVGKQSTVPGCVCTRTGRRATGPAPSGAVAGGAASMRRSGIAWTGEPPKRRIERLIRCCARARRARRRFLCRSTRAKTLRPVGSWTGEPPKRRIERLTRCCVRARGARRRFSCSSTRAKTFRPVTTRGHTRANPRTARDYAVLHRLRTCVPADCGVPHPPNSGALRGYAVPDPARACVTPNTGAAVRARSASTHDCVPETAAKFLRVLDCAAAARASSCALADYGVARAARSCALADYGVAWAARSCALADYGVAPFLGTGA